MDGKDMKSILHMKHMMNIVTNKKYFDNYLKKLEKLLKVKTGVKKP